MQSRKILLAKPRKYSEVISEKPATFIYSCKSSASSSMVERKNGQPIMEEFRQIPIKTTMKYEEEQKERASQQLSTFYNFQLDLSECCEEYAF